MKITKGQFEDKILEHFETVTGVFAPTGLKRIVEDGAWAYIDKRTGVTIATWCRGTGTIFDFSSAGIIKPSLKINLIFSKNHLTAAGIWFRIERQAQTRKQ